MDCRQYISVLLVLLLFGRSECQHNGSDVEENAVQSDITSSLIHIGKRTKNPLIELLGKSLLTIENKMDDINKLVKDANIEKQLAETSRIEQSLERTINETEKRIELSFTAKFDTLTKEICRMYTCSEWSEWTRCDAASYGEYGLKTRSRECGKRATICTEATQLRQETDNAICQFVCPPDYNVTSSEYCVKLYKYTKKSREDAEKYCQHDGGHLINIDSYSKSEDVKDILEHETPNRVWIDGVQRSRDGEWEFSYGSMNSEFTNWHYDQPNENTYPNCMYLLPSDWDWADYPCHHSYNFMCEIVS